MAVLLSYHGNDESDAALRAAIRLTEMMRSSLVVLVAARTGADDDRTVTNAHERLWGRLEGTDIPFQVLNAPAGHTISQAVLDTAAEIEPDVIVLGLRIGGSRVTTLGANAQRVLLDAPCPVLTTTQFILDA